MRSIALGLAIIFCHSAFSDQSLSDWISGQRKIAIHNLMANISPPGAACGAVVASPSKSNPDYFKHWVRDAGLTMNLVISLYEGASDRTWRENYFQRMMDYVDFSRRNQTTPNPSGGLGEPLFYANGAPYTPGWGRPQNDSPAIRAMVLARWANVLLDQGKVELVKEKIYYPGLPAHTVVKADLEYTSHHWRETCFDLWEEVRGHHFYTRMVQRKALIEGAKLADRMGDGGAALWYREQAKQISVEIEKHWSSQKNIIETTLHRDGGVDYKHSNLDASTLLGILHADTFDGFFPVYDERALATAEALVRTFHGMYPVNQTGEGIAIGRYPEDRYDGNGFSEGNPWLLLTAAVAEFHYRVAKGLRVLGHIDVTRANESFYRSVSHGLLKSGAHLKAGDPAFDSIVDNIRDRGDGFMARVRRHTGGDGSMSEQMNRYSGFLQGAPDLTWSYAAFLVAAWER